MPYKTPEEDAKRFESFLEDMEDKEFDYWYDNEATNKQKDLADQLRETGYSDMSFEDNQIEKHRDALRLFYSKWK